MKKYYHYDGTLAKEYVVEGQNSDYFTYHGSLYSRKKGKCKLVSLVANAPEQLKSRCIEFIQMLLNFGLTKKASIFTIKESICGIKEQKGYYGIITMVRYASSKTEILDYRI